MYELSKDNLPDAFILFFNAIILPVYILLTLLDRQIIFFSLELAQFLLTKQLFLLVQNSGTAWIANSLKPPINSFKEMVHWNVENGQITPLQIAENIIKMSKVLLKPSLLWGIN